MSVSAVKTEGDFSWIVEPLRRFAVPIADLVEDPANARRHDERNLDAIRASLSRWGQRFPLVVQKQGRVVRAGNGRLRAARELGWTHIAAVFVDESDVEATAFAIADNRTSELAAWDEDALARLLSSLDGELATATGFSDEEIAALLAESSDDAGAEDKPTLAERFLAPPFSVLDTRQGYWTERKAQWNALGFESDQGRGVGLIGKSDEGFCAGKLEGRYEGGFLGYRTSVFDPVLCELVYSWFMPRDGGLVWDPFAGGCVRGVVAAKLGLRYQGVDLRREQVEANREQAARICEPSLPIPVWIEGDSREIGPSEDVDLVFSCPPFGDLEVYSDDPRDLSTMGYDDFVDGYRVSIERSVDKLREGRFAVFVVAEFRNKAGFYRGFVRDTQEAFERCGLQLYNEAILVTSPCTMTLRAGKQFQASRKLGKTHQNVLIFLRGSPKGIRRTFGDVAVRAIEEEA